MESSRLIDRHRIISVLDIHNGGRWAMTCIWEQDENGNWATSCGEMFVVEEGTPFENGMRYCCYCGKPLKDVPYTEPEDDEK